MISFNYGKYSNQGFSSNLALSDAYSHIQDTRPHFTNYTDTFVGTLDYIFFGSRSFDVTQASYSTNTPTTPLTIRLQILEPVDEEPVKHQVAMPNASYPSDHIPLVADLVYRNTDAEQLTNNVSRLSLYQQKQQQTTRS